MKTDSMNTTASAAQEPILRVENLSKYFDIQENVIARSRGNVKAVDDISFSVPKGTVFGLVGESGCGKSTTARLILRLLTPTAGKVYFDGNDVFALNQNHLQKMRRDIQMIFQDPYSSLNPRWRIGQILAEPLDTHNIGTKAERQETITKILETVGLHASDTMKYPHEFSGGQRQRIGIARALITNPKFVICDEPISALDVSIQAQIINLLKELQQQFELTYLFITHDLRVVRFLCDDVGVMYLGKLVETGSTRSIFENTLHPYSQALFSAIPHPDPFAEKEEVTIEGDVPSPLNPPPGCRFHTRCPHAFDRCSAEEPLLQVKVEGHFVACHLYD